MRKVLAFHGWRMVGVLAVTETVSWGVLYYPFAVVQVPMRVAAGLVVVCAVAAVAVARGTQPTASREPRLHLRR